MRFPDEKVTTAIAVVGATAGLMGWLFVRKQRKAHETADDSNSNSFTYVRLTEFEDMALTRGSAPISTITWFSGNHEHASVVIQQRVEQICKANPWLLGHIVKGKEGDGKNYIAYKHTEESTSPVCVDAGAVLKHVQAQDSTLDRDTPFANVASRCGTLILKMHNDMHQPFWKVSIVPCSKSPSTTFAVVVSMSHVVGDGHTFYSLHNMLLGGEKVRAMQVERIAETTKLQIERMGIKEQRIMSSAGFILCAIRGLLLQKVLAPILGLVSTHHRFHPHARYFMVDLTVMAQLKTQAASDKEVPFCSSNDVITSWFLRNCGCQHGLMAINFRNRLDRHSNAHAGNYENLLYYRSQKDCATPALVRQSLAKLKRSVTYTVPPSVLEMATGSVAFCTNWASFNADKVDLPGCRQQVHLPIYDLVDNLPSTMAVCIIFKPNPKQLAICVSGTPDKMQGVSQAPFESSLPLT